MNIEDSFPLGWTGWISMLSKGLSRVFSSTTVQKASIFWPSQWGLINDCSNLGIIHEFMFFSSSVLVIYERINTWISQLSSGNGQAGVTTDLLNCGSSTFTFDLSQKTEKRLNLALFKCFHAYHIWWGEGVFFFSLDYFSCLCPGQLWDCSRMKSSLLCGAVGLTATKRILQHGRCVATAAWMENSESFLLQCFPFLYVQGNVCLTELSCLKNSQKIWHNTWSLPFKRF